jgi:hypothetical protein
MRAAKAIKIVALVPPVLAMAVMLLFAVGEMAGGDASGVHHLIPAALFGLLAWFGWKQPGWGGALLLLAGLLVSLVFAGVLRGPHGVAPFLIMIAPLFVAGLLLLVARVIDRGSAGSPAP